jgi:hypothetical protein
MHTLLACSRSIPDQNGISCIVENPWVLPACNAGLPNIHLQKFGLTHGWDWEDDINIKIFMDGSCCWELDPACPRTGC